MRDDNNGDYYARREQCQLRFADAASDPAIAAIHRELATRYARLATDAVRDTPWVTSTIAPD